MNTRRLIVDFYIIRNVNKLMESILLITSIYPPDVYVPHNFFGFFFSNKNLMTFSIQCLKGNRFPHIDNVLHLTHDLINDNPMIIACGLDMIYTDA